MPSSVTTAATGSVTAPASGPVPGRDRDFSAVAQALAAPARSVFCNLLMDGTARPAGELARAAGIGASTASEHLSVLVAAGLLECTASGRRRYYRLAGPEVARALEALGALTGPTPVRGYRPSRQAARLAAARFCYDHLAGRLGVALSEAWHASGWLREGLTPAGAEGFAGLGVDVAAARAARRPTVRTCADWTERRPHLAGALGAAVGARFLAAGWVERHRTDRGLSVTPAGRELLAERWGIGVDEEPRTTGGAVELRNAG